MFVCLVVVCSARFWYRYTHNTIKMLDSAAVLDLLSSPLLYICLLLIVSAQHWVFCWSYIPLLTSRLLSARKREREHGVFTVDEHGGTFVSKDDGNIVLIIPSLAVPVGEKVVLRHTVREPHCRQVQECHGLPSHESLLTPVVEYKSPSGFVFMRAVTIRFQLMVKVEKQVAVHCYKLENGSSKWDKLAPDQYCIHDGQSTSYIDIKTNHFTKFVCTCENRPTGGISFDALVVAEDSRINPGQDIAHEIIVSIHVFDNIREGDPAEEMESRLELDAQEQTGPGNPTNVTARVILRDILSSVEEVGISDNLVCNIAAVEQPSWKEKKNDSWPVSKEIGIRHLLECHNRGEKPGTEDAFQFTLQTTDKLQRRVRIKLTFGTSRDGFKTYSRTNTQMGTIRNSVGQHSVCLPLFERGYDDELDEIEPEESPVYDEKRQSFLHEQTRPGSRQPPSYEESTEAPRRQQGPPPPRYVSTRERQATRGLTAKKSHFT